LQPLERVFDDPKTAAVQPKIRSHRDPHLFEYAGAAGGYLDVFGYPFCRGRVFDTVEEDNGQYDDSPPLFWASGAAFAVRKDLFLELGGFDEAFEFHMEEIDLCWRCLNRGYKVRIAPESRVFHLGGGSLPMNSSRKTFFNFRNSLQMLWKNASPDWLRRRFFLRLLLDGLAGLYALLKGHPTDTFAILRAHLHFYILWPRVHRKRKELQAARTNDSEPGEMAPFSILYRYFVRRSRYWNELYED
ncbi:MAG: glycosyltransferase family 2 protein, partial [Balneolaceae bacterium]